MTDQVPGPAPGEVPPEETPHEELYGVPDERFRALHEALAAGDAAACEALTLDLHAADLADLIEGLSGGDRRKLFELIGDRVDPELLTFLDDDVRVDLVETMEPSDVAAVVTELDTDDAVNVFESLSEPVQAEVLEQLGAADRRLVEEALAWPEDSAGRLMERAFVSVPSFWTVGDAIDYLRDEAERGGDRLPDEFFDLYVVDPGHHPVGSISLSRLLRNRRPVRLEDLMDVEIHAVPVETDQEEVARLFRQYDLASAPVIDADGRLVGVITHDDVMDVIHEEAEEDMMRLSGVRAESDFYRAVLDTTGLRFSWLAVNLLTAIIASAVIGLFQATIKEVVALAVLMPIVASMGGNAGTQTLTVAVRALATRELTFGNALRVVGKETVVGAINGVLFAGVMGIVAWIWFGSPAIGAVIAAAMIVNLAVAGFAGVVIPLGLERFNIDPAIASSVFLTTLTDVFGFFAFLGLAALVLV